jgi:hypothetical protein
MAEGRPRSRGDLASLLGELSDEIDTEAKAALTPEDKRMDEIAREILRLERDLTVPGTTSSEAARIERLMNFIEGQEF